jgi:hypothetical protein
MKTMIFFFTFSILIPAQEIHNGNWWLGQDYKTKGYYVNGYLDGTLLGLYFCTLHESDTTFTKKVGESYDHSYNEYLFNVSVSQVCEGLDSLYSDYRNRNILVQFGIWAVLHSIHGISQTDYEQMLEKLRKITVRK